MYASLKSFSKGKTPGTDGLTAEFYLSFWELLGQELVESFNYAFEKVERYHHSKERYHHSNSKEGQKQDPFG